MLDLTSFSLSREAEERERERKSKIERKKKRELYARVAGAYKATNAVTTDKSNKSRCGLRRTTMIAYNLLGLFNFALHDDDLGPDL